ncbi:serine protease [Hwanghaeella grinnelliae]|uniref:Serine protease n=1 Tax=Hwanghaeella grinnelliae TaxID=2500179 RepID=A0A3S2VQJ6_9PROT|nr:serine protease [Hwanghaeella grinnelliae]RVU36655.1 serine protease [Hwanghaeella grinnelliae]
MRNTRFLWILLTAAFIVLSVVTDFDSTAPRRPVPPPSGQTETRENFDVRRAATGPIQRWLLQADTDRVRSTGTAFAVADGLWLTARHVVDQCDSVWLIKPGKKIKRDQKAQGVMLHPKADIALLQLPLRVPLMQTVTTAYHPARSANGFQLGYPGGDPGDVFSLFMGDSAATIRGRGAATFPIQVWAAKEIPARLTSLGGLSGGPAFDETGRVIGVTIAESPRRGRVATTQATLSSEMIDLAGAAQQFAIDARHADPVPNLTPSTYQEKGDALRAALSVVQVYCHVKIPGRRSPLDSL